MESVTDHRRVMRVFVSSTFRDMHAEREELVKRVFPQLRKRCELRGVEWGEVDLRWGITDEQRAEGQVLPVCLAEIERCQAFLGLLGERYGWVPESIPEALTEVQPWLKEHRTRSVTELEILHGALRNAEAASRAYFYFRDPGYLERLPPGTDRSGHACENPLVEERLRDLKTRLRASTVTVREGFLDAGQLGEWVLADLAALIDRLYPEEPAADPVMRERVLHEAFAQSRRHAYIARGSYFATLDAQASSNGPPLAVLGEAGAGKSALLANWALRWREGHPADAVVLHFAGATGDGANWFAMVNRLLGEIRQLGVEVEVPRNPDGLRQAFAMALQRVAARGRLVLVLGALDQLEDRDGAPDLAWLPGQLPAGVRLVASTLPGRALDEIRRRHWAELCIEPLTPEERRRLIVEYLAPKQLRVNQVERIASAGPAGNPLYLRSLLEELRVYGDHDTVDRRIAHYLAAGDTDALFERILARWEGDYDRDRAGLVRDAMTLLWAARHGLRETELLEALGVPQGYWAPLRLAAEGALLDRGGLIGFSHVHLRQGIRRRYLASPEAQRAAHQRIAAYFQDQEPGPRRTEELPWQLAESADWDRLAALLADPLLLAETSRVTWFDLQRYWALLERHSRWRMAKVYPPLLEKLRKHDDWSWNAFSCHEIAGQLLQDAGHWPEALAVRKPLVEHWREREEKLPLATALSQVSESLMSLGEPGQAMEALQEEERICRDLNDAEMLEACLGSQAVILLKWGALRHALRLLGEQERICRDTGNRAGLAASLGNQGTIRRDLGEFQDALRLLEESQRLSRELGDPASAASSLANSAMVEIDLGQLDSAMEKLEHAEKTFRELGDRHGVATSLGNRAIVCKAWGKLDQAMGLIEEKERMCRDMHDQPGLARALGIQANIRWLLGDFSRALALHHQEAAIYEELGDLDGLQASLGNQGNALLEQGRLPEAMELYEHKERICRQLDRRAALAKALNNRALIFKKWGDYTQAALLFEEKIAICRELEDLEGLGSGLNNLGVLRRETTGPEAALALFREGEQMYRKLGNPRGLAAALANQASALAVDLKQPERALPMMAEVLKAARQSGSPPLVKQTEELARFVDEAAGRDRPRPKRWWRRLLP